MKIQKTGYIKLHRKFLESHVHKLKGVAFRLFIDLLLLADKEGVVNTSFRELLPVTDIGCHKDLKRALEELEKVDAIEFESVPNLLIKLKNWSVFQARNCGEKPHTDYGENPHTDYGENPHTTVGKNPTLCGENPHTPNKAYKVPVPISSKNNNNFKNSKTAQKENLKLLNFQQPQTDLEQLILFYLKGTKHPALKKPDNNDLLNLAVRNDIPHFKTILANCENLQQAKKCVKKYVSEAKGAYSMFYLAGQINSVRQEVESMENKR